MRVLWITDFGIHHNIGGSQRTDSFIIEEGKRRGEAEENRGGEEEEGAEG